MITPARKFWKPSRCSNISIRPRNIRSFASDIFLPLSKGLFVQRECWSCSPPSFRRDASFCTLRNPRCWPRWRRGCSRSCIPCSGPTPTCRSFPSEPSVPFGSVFCVVGLGSGALHFFSTPLEVGTPGKLHKVRIYGASRTKCFSWSSRGWPLAAPWRRPRHPLKIVTPSLLPPPP